MNLAAEIMVGCSSRAGSSVKLARQSERRKEIQLGAPAARRIRNAEQALCLGTVRTRTIVSELAFSLSP